MQDDSTPSPETRDATRDSQRLAASLQPGVILVFSGASAKLLPFAVGGSPFPIGRERLAGAVKEDERISRIHAEIERRPSGWVVRDLQSRNGTFVDGERIEGEVVVHSPRVIRAGDTLFVPSDDIGNAYPSAVPGTVVGSKLRAAMEDVDRAASSCETLLILGESGTGKELAARRFHARGPHAAGPFVAINWRRHSREGLAERLLFGAKRGAYSGATADAAGHVQAADSGVLFLDEGGELDLLVQAKLLRFLRDARGGPSRRASHGSRISTRICIATHRDLRAAVADGRFRADLYHRIAPPEVTLPPLRERLDEITEHVVAAIAQATPELAPQCRLIEACLLRPWPGNVRELRKQLQDAALRAAGKGADRVRLEHLSTAAGTALAATPAPDAARGLEPRAAFKEPREYVRWSSSITVGAIESALADAKGNVSAAARKLGMSRAQIYREMLRLSVAGDGRRGDRRLAGRERAQKGSSAAHRSPTHVVRVKSSPFDV